ncbi:unnamed protein product [Plutella xylostella]|uniref:General transcription factor IIH subunit n=1 Tax=Plutella xylostella TaxID=51655 RepID=A0A8S4FAF8_PLUXY|nr:unnamed protein product [Plutella xylostella]
MADDEQDPKEYRWETGYEKTWEAIKEDKDGLVAGLVAEFAQKAARKAATPRRGPIRLGMMRHLIVAIDCSEAMSLQDLKPTRFLCTIKMLEKFVEEFFDQNPLSQLGIIAMKNKRAERITELSGNIRKHLKAVQSLSNIPLTGEPSLQNALELAGRALRPLPGHASRELLLLFAALTSCDPGDIAATIQLLLLFAALTSCDPGDIAATIQVSVTRATSPPLYRSVYAVELLYRSVYNVLPGHASRELLLLFAALTSCDPGDIAATIQVSVLLCGATIQVSLQCAAGARLARAAAAVRRAHQLRPGRHRRHYTGQCDPGDIAATIQGLKTDGIRCSVIGLAAEVRICKKLCQDTGGDYGVVLDDVHYRSLLLASTQPPPRARSLDAGLVKMGFPHSAPAAPGSADPPVTVCMCHLEEGEGICGDGHFCPQCRSKYCSLPAQCRTCGLTLASAPHLARSYHHLFPVESYEEMPYTGQAPHCFGCLRAFTDTDKQIHKCSRCLEHYCWECEMVVSTTLHVCPGCASRPHLYQRLPDS